MMEVDYIFVRSSRIICVSRSVYLSRFWCNLFEERSRHKARPVGSCQHLQDMPPPQSKEIHCLLGSPSYRSHFGRMFQVLQPLGV